MKLEWSKTGDSVQVFLFTVILLESFKEIDFNFKYWFLILKQEQEIVLLANNCGLYSSSELPKDFVNIQIY